MGNSYSDPNLQLYVKVGKAMYDTGDMIEGSAKLIARAPFLYDRLMLKLECYEYCQWKRHANSYIVDGPEYPDFEGHSKLYCQIYNLAEFPGGLRAGFYEFPFAVKIPADLPGRFELIVRKPHYRIREHYLRTDSVPRLQPGPQHHEARSQLHRQRLRATTVLPRKRHFHPNRRAKIMRLYITRRNQNGRELPD